MSVATTPLGPLEAVPPVPRCPRCRERPAEAEFSVAVRDSSEIVSSSKTVAVCDVCAIELFGSALLAIEEPA